MKATIGGRIECVRDTVTGRFVPKVMAKRRPRTTVTEKRKQARLKNGKFARSC